MSEALLLEANLIKRFKPRFNIRLKDDKSYPYIKITLGDDFPRVERTRKLPKDGSRYFGPYASASSVDEAMNLVRRLFPFRTCTIDIKDGERALARPCLLYHIKRCQGPCIEAIVEGRLPPRHRPGRAVPRGQRRRAGRRPPPRDGLRRRAAAVREGGGRPGQDPGDRADDGEPEDGRVRPHRAGPRGARPQGRPGGGPAVRGPQRQDARPRRVLPRRPARHRRRRGRSAASSQQYYAQRDERPARGPRAALPRRHGRSRGVPGREAAAARVSLRDAAARREAGADGPRHAQRRRRRSRARRPAGSPTRAGRWARSRSWRRRSACPGRRCGSSATTSRTSRARSPSAAWSCSRRAGRGRGSTAGSGSGPSRAPNDFASHQEVLRRRFRRGRAGEEGTRRSAAGRCPTS